MLNFAFAPRLITDCPTSGYDFGYLMRTLIGAPLPLTEDEFFSLLKIWFPNIFDIKYIIRQCKPSMKGGLQEIAQEMGVGNTVCSLHSFEVITY